MGEPKGKQLTAQTTSDDTGNGPKVDPRTEIEERPLSSTEFDQLPTIYLVIAKWEADDLRAVGDTGNRVVAAYTSLDDAKDFAQKFATHVAKTGALALKKSVDDEDLREDFNRVLEIGQDEYNSVDYKTPRKFDEKVRWDVLWKDYTTVRVEKIKLQRGPTALKGLEMPVPMHMLENY